MTSKVFPSADLLFFTALFLLSAYIVWYPTLPGDLLVFSTFTASKWCALGIVICSGFEILSILRKSTTTTTEEKRNLMVVLFIGGTILYLVSLFYFSYYSCTAVAMLAGFAFLGGRKAVGAGAVCVLLWLWIVYLVFEKLLTIVLPAG